MRACLFRFHLSKMKRSCCLVRSHDVVHGLRRRPRSSPLRRRRNPRALAPRHHTIGSASRLRGIRASASVDVDSTCCFGVSASGPHGAAGRCHRCPRLRRKKLPRSPDRLPRRPLPRGSTAESRWVYSYPTGQWSSPRPTVDLGTGGAAPETVEGVPTFTSIRLPTDGPGTSRPGLGRYHYGVWVRHPWLPRGRAWVRSSARRRAHGRWPSSQVVRRS